VRVVQGEGAARTGGITGRVQRLLTAGFTRAEARVLAADGYDVIGQATVVDGLPEGWSWSVML
jgi:hypothetical protein